MNIHFGTDGWRAKIADEFTFDNVRKVAQAIADYLNRGQRSEVTPRLRSGQVGQIIVGYDKRFLSSDYAKSVSEVLAANNLKPLLTDSPTPTPAISLAIKQKKLDGGIIITASHNPPLFNGIKFKSDFAGPASEETTKGIEALIGKNDVKRINFDDAVKSRNIEFIDASAGYIKFLQNYVDIKKIKNARLNILLDYMHGAGSGYMEKILGKNNNCRIEALRDNDDPLFGGVNPEPIPKNLKMPLSYIRKKKFDLGIALDGDADRIGAIRPDGAYITSGQIISLILLHFLEDKNRRGKVAKTISGTTLIERICSKYRLKLFETPVGFKNIAALMQKENILIGGEESGGIGFSNYIPERDGILSALLLMEMLASRKKSIKTIMADMDKQYGKFCYDRIDLEYSCDKARELTARLKENPPKEIAGKRVKNIKSYDGIKFIMEDDSWLLLRFSGTEPLIRIYAEAPSSVRVKNLLKAGNDLL